MLVKVAPMGEQVVEVNVDSGLAVCAILDIAGVDHEDRAITVNNESATLSTAVNADNSVISLANKMKGGQVV